LFSRFGGLEDFEKGVRELVGAPHPMVWDEINKEHRHKADSKRVFCPGNNDIFTCPENEFLIVIDPKKGKEVSQGKRYNTAYSPFCFISFKVLKFLQIKSR
jgi:hypothetical protein